MLTGGQTWRRVMLTVMLTGLGVMLTGAVALLREAVLFPSGDLLRRQFLGRPVLLRWH